MSAAAFWTPARRLTLERDGADWPNRRASRILAAGGLDWHVQIMGAGPVLLLLHGAGAASHSFRDVAPILARRFRVIVPDLPGHGFTSSRGVRSQSMAGMARALCALLRTLDAAPDIAVGHSAGAALLARLAIDEAIAPRLIVALNGAFAPFDGVAGHILPPMAKLLFLNPLAPRYFAWAADRAAVGRLLAGTGSSTDERGVELYARLLQSAPHVEGALGMMAHWDLHGLRRDLPKLRRPCALLVGKNDRTVSPESARAIARLLIGPGLMELDGLGHLAHEEAPEHVAGLVLRLAEETLRAPAPSP